MNWNGGALSRSRNTANTPLSAAQKRHFAQARAKAQAQPQFKVDLEFSALEHAKKDELATRKRITPSRRVDHHADSSKASPTSLNKGRAVIPPLSSSSPAFPLSSECKKDDSLEDQKRKLLAMNDWCGLKKPLPVERVSTSIADVVVDRHGCQGYERSRKRRLSDSSEAYPPSEGLIGIIDSLKTPDARNLHSTEGKRHIANKSQQSGSARRILPSGGRSGVHGFRPESCSLHRASPFYSVLEPLISPHASPYLNSDENLFADEHTKSQPLFQPSPLRSIAYDWSDIRSDAVPSAGSQPDIRSMTDSPVGTEPKLANHPSIPDLPQVRSTIRTRPPAELIAHDAPMMARDNISHVTKSRFIDGAAVAPAKPNLHSQNFTQFLLEDDVFETGPKTGKFDQDPQHFEAAYRCSEIKAQPHLAKTVKIAATDTTEHMPRAQEECCMPSVLLAPAQSPRTTKGEKLLSPDSGWENFVVGSADGEISDISSSIRRSVKTQTDPQSPDACRNMESPSPSSSPHQFAFLYSEPSNEPSLDQQIPQEPHQHQDQHQEISSPHRFSPISSDQPTDAQSTAQAAIDSLPEASREIPLCSPEQSPTLQHQLASPQDRESTEEQEQPAERFAKPTFIFTKPARFQGDRAIGLSSLTGTGEARRRSIDSGLGQVQPEWQEEEEEDIED